MQFALLNLLLATVFAAPISNSNSNDLAVVDKRSPEPKKGKGKKGKKGDLAKKIAAILSQVEGSAAGNAVTGAVDNGTGAVDNEAGAVDNGAGAVDNGAGAVDNGNGGVDTTNTDTTNNQDSTGTITGTDTTNTDTTGTTDTTNTTTDTPTETTTVDSQAVQTEAVAGVLQPRT